MCKPHPKPRIEVVAVLICVMAAGLFCIAGEQAPKPKLKVAADGFPSGHDTPEGAACDLARAYIRRDEKLFSDTCLAPWVGQTAYAAFLRGAAQQIKTEAAKKQPEPDAPNRIYKVFAARHLTMSGPVSFAYACCDYQDVMFVDVGVYLNDGRRFLRRTLVIQDNHGKWYVHPDLKDAPLMSAGLDREKASVLDFIDVYDVEGKPPKPQP